MTTEEFLLFDEAQKMIHKLVGIVSATHPDAYKGWACGDRVPYDIAGAGADLANKIVNYAAANHRSNSTINKEI